MFVFILIHLPKVNDMESKNVGIMYIPVILNRQPLSSPGEELVRNIRVFGRKTWLFNLHFHSSISIWVRVNHLNVKKVAMHKM